MADIAVGDLKRSKSRGPKKMGSVREKRVRDSDGKIVRVLSINSNSATFIDDLTTIFERNVRKARLENIKLFGSPDGLKPKKK